MAEEFDRKKYEAEVEQMSLAEVLAERYGIDERTRADLARRDVLSKRLTRLALDRFRELPAGMDSFDEAGFMVTKQQVEKPDMGLLHDIAPETYKFITEEKYQFLKMAKDDLRSILIALGIPRQEVDALLTRVCRSAEPTIRTKRL